MAPARSLLLLHLIPFVCHALRETVRPLMVFAEPGERREGWADNDAGLCLKNEQLLASFISVRPSVRPPTAFPPYPQPVASVGRTWVRSFERTTRRTKKKLPRYFPFSFRSLMYVRSNSVVSTVSTLILRARTLRVCGCVHNVGLPPLQIGHACLSKMGREGEREEPGDCCES